MRKENLIRNAIVNTLNISPDLIEFERLPTQSLKIEIIQNSTSRVILKRTGPGFYKQSTPDEIANLLKSFH